MIFHGDEDCLNPGTPGPLNLLLDSSNFPYISMDADFTCEGQVFQYSSWEYQTSKVNCQCKTNRPSWLQICWDERICSVHNGETVLYAIVESSSELVQVFCDSNLYLPNAARVVFGCLTYDKTSISHSVSSLKKNFLALFVSLSLLF